MKTYMKKIDKLKYASQSAINVFSRTIEQLKKHNDELDSTVQKMNDDIERLKALKFGAESHKAQNNAVIENIEKIVGAK